MFARNREDLALDSLTATHRTRALEVRHDRLGENVRLQIERPTDRPGAERGELQRGGYQRDVEVFAFDAGDRQAHAVDGDRAFVDDVLYQLRRRVDRQAPFSFIANLLDQLSDVIDVALD